jgi:DNA repair exonuclease SbcCD ATPase subunit
MGMESPHMPPWLQRTLFTLLAAAFSGGANGELYRYQNEDGKVVYDQHVPPQYVKRGYEVLSDDGELIRVVPGELTPEEKKRRDARIAAEKAEQHRLEEQRKNDAELMRLYKSVEDVENARDRKIKALQNSIDLSQENLDRLFNQKRNVESHAATLERDGLPVNEDIMEQLRAIESQIATQNAEIEARKREQDDIRDQYGRDIERLQELLSRLQPNYTSG